MTKSTKQKLNIIEKILSDNNYHLSFFKGSDIDELKRRVSIKTIKHKPTAFIQCLLRDKNIQLKPEELVRQLYAMRLIKQYGYPKLRLAFEHPINFGREKKSADIVIFDKDQPDIPYIIVELKKQNLWMANSNFVPIAMPRVHP